MDEIQSYLDGETTKVGVVTEIIPATASATAKRYLDADHDGVLTYKDLLLFMVPVAIGYFARPFIQKLLRG